MGVDCTYSVKKKDIQVTSIEYTGINKFIG